MESGRLLMCPSNGTEKILDCQEFAEIEWTLDSWPTVKHIGSRNDGYVYASVIGAGVNDMWRCDPKKPKSCELAFKLPKNTLSFLTLD